MRAWRSLSGAMLKAMVTDKSVIFFYILFPLMFLVLFGLLFGNPSAGRVSIGVTGEGPLVDGLPEQVFEITHYDDFDAAVEDVRSGDLPAAVWVSGTTVDLRFSGTAQVAAGVAQGAMRAAVAQANLAVAGAEEVYSLEVSRVEDESFTAIQFLTAGLLSWAIAMSAAFGAALNLVMWRKSQVLRRLRLAPISPVSIIGARAAVSLLFAMVQAVIFVSIAMTPPFGLQLRGHWYLMVPLLVAGTFAFLSIGLLIGSVVHSEEAATTALNLVILPMAFLSGTFFQIDTMPAWLQNASWVLPMRHLSNGLLDALVREGGFGRFALTMVVLVGFGLVFLAIATRFFSWED